MSSDDIHEVFSTYGVSAQDLSLAVEGDRQGRFWCPACHYRAFETAKGLISHTAQVHDESIMQSLCGESNWRSILSELHDDRELSPKEIARALPEYVGPRSIRADLKSHDLYVRREGGGLARKGLARKLASMSVDEFDAAKVGGSR